MTKEKVGRPENIHDGYTNCGKQRWIVGRG